MSKNIQNNNIFIKMTVLIVVIFTLFGINACTGVNLNKIPTPPPTTELRLVIVTITRPEPWMVPHKDYVNFVSIPFSNYLSYTGMYEIVSPKDVEAVLGRPEESIEEYWWLRNNCDLPKRLGKALYADYVMIISRTAQAGSSRHKMVLINLETGAQYSTASDFFGTKSDYLNAKIAIKSNFFTLMYQRLFFDAKSDLLATAMRKRNFTTSDVSRIKEETKVSQLQIPAKPASEPPMIPQMSDASKQPSAEETPTLTKEPPETKTPTESPVPQTSIAAKISQDLSPVDKRQEFNNKLEQEFQGKTVGTDNKHNLVVYDFATIENLNVVALILTEALRQELFVIGKFNLINRENMQKLMQELQFQQSGMVDEKQVVKLGKLLAAHEAVTGRLAVLDRTYILQAKRTDIKTFATLGVGSLKCAVGNAEDLLSGIPGLARRLIE